MGAYPSSRVQIHPPCVGSPDSQCVHIKLRNESLKLKEQSSLIEQTVTSRYLASSSRVSPSTSHFFTKDSKHAQIEFPTSTDLAISFSPQDTSTLSPQPNERLRCAGTQLSPNITTMISTVAYSGVACHFVPQSEVQPASSERSEFVDVSSEVAIVCPISALTENELKRLLHLCLSLKDCKPVLTSLSHSLIVTNGSLYPYRQYVVCHGENILVSKEVSLAEYTKDISSLENVMTRDSSLSNCSIVGGVSDSSDDNVSLSFHREGVSPSMNVSQFKRPVWYFMDSLMIRLSPGTLDSLKCYAPFAWVIRECCKALPAKVSDLLLSEFSQTVEQGKFNLRVVSSTAISIALCELLGEVGITPDSIITGNAIGYLTLCYLDGVLTIKQCMQVAHFIDQISSRDDVPEGASAAIVGLTSTECTAMCPDNVYVSCVHGANSVSITGEKEAVVSFVTKLEQEAIAHVELISSSCLPVQTPLIQSTFDTDALSALRSIIRTPKPLSTKCVVALDTDSPQLECSAEVLMCALTYPANFLRVFETFPRNGIILDLGSTPPLHAALRVQALSSDNTSLTVIPVLSHNEPDPSIALMQVIGDCHNAGLNVNPLRLFDTGEQSQPISPCASETICRSDPSTRKDTTNTSPLNKYPSSLICATTDLVSVIGEKMKINEYMVNGVATVPTAYPLMLVWKTLADKESRLFIDLPVIFEDVTFHCMIDLSKDKQSSLCILISSLSGHFEVSVNDKVLVASGRIVITRAHHAKHYVPVQRYKGESVCNKKGGNTADCTACTSNDISTTNKCVDYKTALDHNTSQTTLKNAVSSTDVMVLKQQDLYKELSLKGHQIGDCFQVLSKASDLLLNECELSLAFTTDIEMLVALIESAFQMGVLQHTSSSCNSVLCPSAIQSLQITPHMLASSHKTCTSTTLYYNAPTDTYYTDGYLLTGLKFIFQTRRQCQELQPRIERYMFQPYFQYILDKHDPSSQEIKTLMDIVVENTSTRKLSVLHVVNADGCNSVCLDQELHTQVGEFARACSVADVIQDTVDLSELLHKGEHTKVFVAATGDVKLYDLIVVSDVNANPDVDVKALLSDKQSSLLNKLIPGGFLLIKEPLSSYESSRSDSPQKSISSDAQKSNLYCVARRHFTNTEIATDSEGVMLLYHHVPDDVITNSDVAVVKVSMKDKSLPWIAQLKKLLKQKVSPKRIYCVSDFEPECPSGILGMTNCLRLESYGDRVRCVYLRDSKLEESEFYSSTIWQQIRTRDMLMNVIKNDQLGSYRHLKLTVNKVCLSPSVDFPIVSRTKSKEMLSSTSKANLDIDFQELAQEEIPSDTEVYSCGSHYPNIGHPTFSSLKSDQFDATSPRFHCHPHKSYIITGGLGGFGLELATWLAEHGARKLILTSRSGIKTSYQARKLNMLQASSVDVIVSNLDVSRESQAHELMDMAVNSFKIDSMGSREIGGIFHLAVVLRDCKFESQSAKRFQTVMGPKSTGALNLDKALHHLSTLEHNVKQTLFVVFSSASSGIGHATQSSYGFANSSMERLCEERQRQGLHGLAVQWGAIGDVGVLYNMMGGRDVESIGGTRSQPLHSCLFSLEIILNLPVPAPPVVSCYVPALNEVIKTRDDNLLSSETGLVRTINKEIEKENVCCTSASCSNTESNAIPESIDASLVVATGIPAISSETSVSTVSTCDSQSDLVNVQERTDE